MILGTAREKWKETWITKQTSKMMRTNKENSKEQSQRRVHADGNPRAPADVSPDTERSCPARKGLYGAQARARHGAQKLHVEAPGDTWPDGAARPPPEN